MMSDLCSHVLLNLLAGSAFFFFKQKTAYEMRISDWSSDVCSSDLSTTPIWTSDCDFPARRAAPACRLVSFVLVSISRSSAPVNFFTLDFAAASTGSAPRSNVRFRTLPCVAFGSSDNARSSSRSPSTFSDIRVIRGGGGLLRRGRLDCHLFCGGRPFCGLGARRGARLALVEHNQQLGRASCRERVCQYV